MRWAAAICETDNPARASHPIARLVGRACRYPETPASASAVQARLPANGSEMAILEPAIPRESASPPTVAAGRPVPSFRRNRYRPSPARIGCRVMNAPSARAHDMDENRAMGGKYIQPD